ncbi:type VI secretion system accessory protein TagJ [Gemmatimonas sp.]|uniref:type VI secretion system accessory protein TagJ n=1 Tax=Gemmatimonas sp. TaxID=1962908 RepID=UPI00286BBEEB|nr:type VI secretion system accessory protein TagJ [Gemmatimonas sp.]
MASSQALYAAGQLGAAIEALGVELRNFPADAQRRTFLFELLTFAGDWARAQKQLDVLAKNGHMAEAGTMLYRSAIEAERVREHMFDTGDFPTTVAPSPVSGTLNGEPFASIEDADPRLGARLEVIAGGRYLWIPFAHLASLSMPAPARLRDLHWAPAQLRTGPSVADKELGEILLPALSVGAWRHAEDEIRLGRATDWEDLPSGEFAPVGQKLLRVDDRLVPLVDVRELVIAS